MALGILVIFDVIIILLFLTTTLLMIYKNGDIAKKTVVFGFIVAYTLLLSFIAFTGLPNNFIFQRIGALVAGFLGVFSLVKIKNFSFARLIIIISMILNLIIIYL